jgi:hypothetical protein
MEIDWGPRKKSVETFVKAVAERIDNAMTRTVFVACGDLDQLKVKKKEEEGGVEIGRKTLEGESEATNLNWSYFFAFHLPQKE